MKVIKISDGVWEAIAAKGKFGETEDDVLRRVFGIRAQSAERSYTRQLRATNRMSAHIRDSTLVVKFADGGTREWGLPARSDKPSIRHVRDDAVDFAVSHGASVGQRNAVMKTLTEAGYHVSK
jgi:hypothetical protein